MMFNCNCQGNRKYYNFPWKNSQNPSYNFNDQRYGSGDDPVGNLGGGGNPGGLVALALVDLEGDEHGHVPLGQDSDGKGEF